MASPRARSPMHNAGIRIVIMAIIGVVVAVVVGLFADPLYAIVAGWVAAALAFVLSVLTGPGRFDAAETQSHATREDPGILPSQALVLAATVGSIVAVVLLILSSRSASDPLPAAALAAASIIVSWVLIHTLYMLRYARIYYAEPVGGIDFNSDEAPRYTDFAYISFDLGMTYQISDTSLSTSHLRAVVLRHTLLSYAFGTMVLASMVNLVLGLA